MWWDCRTDVVLQQNADAHLAAQMGVHDLRYPNERLGNAAADVYRRAGPARVSARAFGSPPGPALNFVVRRSCAERYADRERLA
jgi:hypothetical protein